MPDEMMTAVRYGVLVGLALLIASLTRKSLQNAVERPEWYHGLPGVLGALVAVNLVGYILPYNALLWGANGDATVVISERYIGTNFAWLVAGIAGCFSGVGEWRKK